MSENGWTDDILCKEWFIKSFIPQATARNTSSKPILLIYDGHGSHDTLDLIEIAREHNIILFCLPPHTTHKLQPLDVGVFGPFSRAWTDRCDEIVEDTGEEMPREDFVKEYMNVRSASFKATTIQTAWRKSGCWPIDQTVFQDEDYAPSISTSSSTLHVPTSFPILLPDEPGFYEYLPNEDKDKDSDSASDDTQFPHGTTATDYPPPHPPNDPTMATTQCCERASLPTSARSVTVVRPAPPTVSTASLQVCPQTTHSRHRFGGTSNRLHALETSNAALQSWVATLEAHCAMAQSEIQDLKWHANVKDASRAQKRPKLNVDARCLTSEEGLWLAQEQQALKEAQVQKKREAQEQ